MIFLRGFRLSIRALEYCLKNGKEHASNSQNNNMHKFSSLRILFSKLALSQQNIGEDTRLQHLETLHPTNALVTLQGPG